MPRQDELPGPLGLPLLLIPTVLEARPLLGEVPVPKGPPERRKLFGHPLTVGLAGVGPIAAAAIAAHWIGQLRPSRVLLAGSAGSLDLDQASVGAVVQATCLHCDGLGFGEGEAHQPLTFPQLVGPQLTGRQRGTGPEELAIVDRIELPEQTTLRGAMAGAVLTAPTSSSNPAEVLRRRTRRPDCLVEEMEGFGVALACRLAGVPLTVLRGVSNLAGDRDHRSWEVDQALHALRPALQQWLEQEA